MKRALCIGHTDLRLFFRHKTALVWLFALPFVSIYITGAANLGPGKPYNRTPPVFVDVADTNFMGGILVNELERQGMDLVSASNRDSAARIIQIPADLTYNVLQLKPTKLKFMNGGDNGEADAALIELGLVRALISLNGHLLEAADARDGLRLLSEHKLKEIMKRPDRVKLNARFAGRKPVPTGFNFSLPGNLVMYLMMNLLIFGGTSMAAERRNGVIQRLMTYPVPKLQLVMGKIYGLMLLGIAQMVVFLLIGKFLFHVNLGANLPGVALALTALVWVAASLGVLVGSLTAAEDRVIGICVLTSLLMAAIGGCWWPLEIGPPMLKTLSLFTPSGWALQALHQLISFGSGVSAVIIPIMVLLAFGLAANLLAARFFKS